MKTTREIYFTPFAIFRSRDKKKTQENPVICQTEKCVLCNCDTNVPKDLPISKRSYYVEGAGQLCEKCCEEIYGKQEKKIAL